MSSIRVVLRGVTRVCMFLFPYRRQRIWEQSRAESLGLFFLGAQSIKPDPGHVTDAPRTGSDNGASPRMHRPHF